LFPVRTYSARNRDEGGRGDGTEATKLHPEAGGQVTPGCPACGMGRRCSCPASFGLKSGKFVGKEGISGTGGAIATGQRCLEAAEMGNK